MFYIQYLYIIKTHYDTYSTRIYSAIIFCLRYAQTAHICWRNKNQIDQENSIVINMRAQARAWAKYELALTSVGACSIPLILYRFLQQKLKIERIVMVNLGITPAPHIKSWLRPGWLNESIPYGFLRLNSSSFKKEQGINSVF